MSKRILIIGGAEVRASAVAHARRVSEDAEIVIFEVVGIFSSKQQI